MFQPDQYPLAIGLFLFDDVEVLDFCGPFEVFEVTQHDDRKSFDVTTIAQKQTITARNGLSVNVDATFDKTPEFDIIVLPGGIGTRQVLSDTAQMEWIAGQIESCRLVLSVCTGALLLAKLGALRGLAATTHHNALDLLKELDPEVEVRPTERFVDNGKFVVAAGISAGIDMSLHVVSRLLGPSTADATAHHMEYDWHSDD